MRKKKLYFTAFAVFAAVLLIGQASVMASPGANQAFTLPFTSSGTVEDGEQASGSESQEGGISKQSVPLGLGPEESVKTSDFSGMIPVIFLFVAIVVAARLVIRRIHRNQE